MHHQFPIWMVGIKFLVDATPARGGIHTVIFVVDFVQRCTLLAFHPPISQFISFR
jgi:hypothetical protein